MQMLFNLSVEFISLILRLFKFWSCLDIHCIREVPSGGTKGCCKKSGKEEKHHPPRVVSPEKMIDKAKKQKGDENGSKG